MFCCCMHRHSTTATTHPTKQKGAAASNSQQKSQKPQKYNFPLHKNCSCHSTTKNCKIPTQKSAAVKTLIQTLTLQQIPIPIQKFQNSNPNSEILPNLNQIPNSTSNSQKIPNFTENPEIPEISRNSKNHLHIHNHTSFVVICCAAVLPRSRISALFACTFILQVLPRRSSCCDPNYDQTDHLRRGDRYASDSNSLVDLQMGNMYAG
jgi:hypothetical protein